MTLELQNVTKAVGGETHIADVSLRLEPGSLNVLLGPTLSGKTSLLRLMAGLDRPSAGRVLWNGADVTGLHVRKRSVAMVYQQFINYPTLSVYENIASPLRVAGRPRDEIDRKVRGAAALLKLGELLDRMPLELSGGQQQRTAIARALVKSADLVLLDEPLVNLDYKLREELREELPRLFAESGSIFVYATTEPSEALLLGGNTAALWQGSLLQFGPTIDVYRRPRTLTAAQIFSDPPMNTIGARKHGPAVSLGGTVDVPAAGALAGLADGEYLVGFRPSHLHLRRREGDAVTLRATVAVTEITGSESFVHLDFAGQRWVALAHGVHDLAIDEAVDVHLAPERFFVFDAAGALQLAPAIAEAA